METAKTNNECLEKAILNLKQLSESLGMRVKISFITYDPKPIQQ